MTPSDFIAEPLSQVAPEPVDWLWEPFLPRGKLVLLDGDPGIGKSMLALDIAARLSRGGDLPNGQSAGRPHVTLILSAEDRAGDTLRPRADAAGANLDHIVRLKSASAALLRLPADLATLEEMVRGCRADLVVVDPLTAFLPAEVSTSNDSSVRRALKALDAMVERTGCTMLLLRHLRKKDTAKAVYRGLGSIGLISAVRVGLLAAHHPSEDELRVLAVAKSNVAAAAGAFGYRVKHDEQGRGAIEWTGRIGIAADELGKRDPELRPRDVSVLWLTDQLAGGPRPSSQVMGEAALAGIPDRTLMRAKADAGIQSHLVVLQSGERIWFLYDPAAPWPADAPFKRPDPSRRVAMLDMDL